MANIIPKKVTVTTTEDTLLLGTSYQELIIKNQGDVDCQVGFDAAVASESYLLEAGEWIKFSREAIIRLHFSTASGSTELYMLKIL